MNPEMFDKNIFPPLKIIRFPKGFVAPQRTSNRTLMREKSDKEFQRKQYSLSVTILDIDHPKNM